MRLAFRLFYLYEACNGTAVNNTKSEPKQKKTSQKGSPSVRHKGLEPSLCWEPDPKSGASTNSANAAVLCLKTAAKVRQIIDVHK